MKARDSPTSNKIRYLLHLNDRRNLASAAVVHAATVLRAIKQWKGSQQDASKIWDAGLTWSERATRLSNDLSFLKKELQSMEGEIKGLQKLLRERVELSHDRRSFLLTLVAAVYLPLSFATSFFGMNIDTATSPAAKGFSNYTSDWIAHSPTEYQNATKALVSTIGTSGTLTFSWETFGITAGCLLLTLPLSLTLGSILRSLYQSTIYYARYWRIVTILGFASFFIISVFGRIIPYMEIPFFVCNGIFALYVYFETYSAWRRQALNDSTARPLYWTFMSLLLTGCFLTEYFTFADFVAELPWGIIFLDSYGSWLRARRRRNNK